MNFKPLFFVCILPIASTALAQDVYNFYFQKNMSPQFPVTGSSANKPATQPAVQKVTSVENPETTATQNKTFRRFEFGLSYGTTSFAEKFEYSDSIYDDDFEMSNGGTGFGIQGGIRFNKFFSLDGMFNVTEVKSEEYDDGRKIYQGSLGLLVTPIHINLFGYELFEISASGGLMNGYKAVISANDFGEDKLQDIQNVYGGYAGARLAANLTSELAVFFDGKQMLGSNNREIEMYQLGLKYRF
jgi:hypothetical protein